MSDQPGTPESTSETTEAAATPPPVAAPTPPVAATPAVTPSTAPAGAKGSKDGMQYGYYWGLGRRKSSVARVRIRPGKGNFEINKKVVNDYFRVDRDRQRIVEPLNAAGCGKNIDVFVNVNGGGTTGQAGAIVLGLARALVKLNADYEQSLRDGDFLTRDSRVVERKKYGRAGARKRFQFSKR